MGSRGGARNFPTGGLTLPTMGLKYGFQGVVNAKNFRQNSFPLSDGGSACSDRGAIAPSSPILVPPLMGSVFQIWVELWVTNLNCTSLCNTWFSSPTSSRFCKMLRALELAQSEKRL